MWSLLASNQNSVMMYRLVREGPMALSSVSEGVARHSNPKFLYFGRIGALDRGTVMNTKVCLNGRKAKWEAI